VRDNKLCGLSFIRFFMREKRTLQCGCAPRMGYFQKLGPL
jgi:hypothetical protein